MPVPLAHVTAAPSSPAATASRAWPGRLVELGYVHAMDPAIAAGLGKGDLMMVSVHLWDRYPWLNPAETGPFAHLVKAAMRTGLSVDWVARRLTSLGYLIEPGLADRPGRRTEDQPTPTDRSLTSRGLRAPEFGLAR